MSNATAAHDGLHAGFHAFKARLSKQLVFCAVNKTRDPVRT